MEDIVKDLFPGAILEAMTRLTGGVSADVHRLDLRMPNGSRTRLVLRSHGASHSGHAAELEFRLLQALHRGGLPVPNPLLADASGRLLPQPFLVMPFIEGTSAISAAPDDPCIDRMADVLAKIHALPTVAGLRRVRRAALHGCLAPRACPRGPHAKASAREHP
jgi:aminoglycoside phosphotransferase (APT) family kinase protein